MKDEMIVPRAGIVEDLQGRCCLNCLWHRQQDGHWCAYGMDDDGNEAPWEEIRGAEDNRCIYWEEEG